MKNSFAKRGLKIRLLLYQTLKRRHGMAKLDNGMLLLIIPESEQNWY